MITIKQAFVQWYKNKYPKETLLNYRGTPCVEVSSVTGLDERYLKAQTTRGTWILFIGATPTEALEWAEKLKQGNWDTYPSGRPRKFVVPTTDNAFVRWIKNCKIEIITRQRMAYVDPNTLGIKGYPPRAYYYNEIPATIDGVPVLTEAQLANVPHCYNKETNTMTILTKASGYTSQKHEHYNEAQVLPKLLEQIKVAVATEDEYVELVQSYLNIFYQKPVVIKGDISPETLRKHSDTLNIYLLSCVKETVDDFE